ncbi:hypothetical protein [Enterobacter quasiroggenkampii]|uniref:hypothetical protein n=1 Tax=Enterobacter quasiroggenkampii TaxID=2497436 RepID=UPI0021D16802|nr:hypothetical protein [Enterobacter quasiroggenkampii]MCU6409295.1 hypothetical protein [Enterobacter quasiroggenkampii]
MEWFTRMLLDLPPRNKDIKELMDSAPELFSNESVEGIKVYHRTFRRHFYWESFELREDIRYWLRRHEVSETDLNQEMICDHPDCQRIKGRSGSNDYMQMMTVAGGRDSNPPAKSFFDLINATKITNAEVQRVILTDPYIYSDIGQNGEGGGFNNLLKLLETLNIADSTEFNLQLTPQNDKEQISRFENSIKRKFPNCSVSNHNSRSTFHDRFILVQYVGGKSKGWYGPSLNGLNGDSIIIFGDLTDSNALAQLSQRLL